MFIYLPQTCKSCPLFQWQFVVYAWLLSVMMNCLLPTFPNGYVQLGTPCLALVSNVLSWSQHLPSLQLPQKSLWWFPEINMKMLSLSVTGLMCAHMQITLHSYTCRTPSRVFTFQALLNYALDSPHHQVYMYTFLSCVIPGWLPCSRLSSTTPACCCCPTVSGPWCPQCWCHI